MKRNPLYGVSRIFRGAILLAATVGVLSIALTDVAFAAEKALTCNQVDVNLFPRHIYVTCSPGDGAIQRFALGVDDAGEANRMLSILSTALVTKRRLTVWYDPNDVTGPSIGCMANNCRLILRVRMF